MPKTENKSDIASAYDGWSGTYESMENATRDLAAAALREQEVRLSGRDALEIGCGTGVNTRYLAENCRSVTAMDFSEGMLREARANVAAENVKFARGDIRFAWEAANSSFDLVVCALVLEHIEDLGHIFDEAARTLRPGGEFLLYELHPYRQLRGGQAQFKAAESEEIVYVPAYLHGVSEFVNTAINAGFTLARLDELRDKNDEAKNALPRVLSLHLRRN